jgi:hypothetical protein
VLRLTGKAKSPLPVPVSPGPQGARQGVPTPCVACGTTHGTIVPVEVEGEWVTCCKDAAGCANRYRNGTSPASYASALRGEILGVAP